MLGGIKCTTARLTTGGKQSLCMHDAQYMTRRARGIRTDGMVGWVGEGMRLAEEDKMVDGYVCSLAMLVTGCMRRD
jgi:hypothetical protein